MSTKKANLINSLTLVIIGLWGYFEVNSPTALIPVFFGLVLFLCNKGVEKENKIVAHLAVLLTFLFLIAMVGMRLPKSLESGGMGLFRVILMILTSTIAMLTFINSFIKNRKAK